MQTVEGAAAEAIEQHALTAELGFAGHLPPVEIVAGLSRFLLEARAWLNEAGATVTCAAGRGTIQDGSLSGHLT